jgi:hypothetical protein
MTFEAPLHDQYVKKYKNTSGGHFSFSSPYVRDLRTHGLEYYMDVSPTAPLLNALFDDFLTHYWTLRVQLRLFGRRANHPVGPQRLVLGDAYLPNKTGAFTVGDSIIVRGNKLC